MKKIFTVILLFASVQVMFTGSVTAQFTISGEFKMRGEYRDGYGSLRDSSKTPYADILGRARLLFDYKSEKITTRFSLYDAFVFGQNNYSSDTISKNTVNIYEAFFKYNFSPNIAVKIGRTELVYDDERFLGSINWSMWGGTHDVVVLQWESPGINYTGHFGIGINNVAPATPFLSSYLLRNYKYIGYFWDQKKFFDNKLTLSFIDIVDVFQKPGTTVTTKTTVHDTLLVKDPSGNIIGWAVDSTTTTSTKTTNYINQLYARFTFGLNGTLNLKKWSFFLTGYYQGGRYKDGRKINSNFYAAWASCQVVKSLKLMAGYEHLSGNDFSDTTEFKKTVKGFSTLYGTGHKFYGYMDMFAALTKDNLSTGLNDLFGRANLSLNDKMSIEATYRWFSIPHKYLYVANPKKGKLPYKETDTKSLGSEIDLMYIYKPIPNLELNAAYCFFLPTETMELANSLSPGTSKWAQYAYIMITYKPNFFSSEKK